MLCYAMLCYAMLCYAMLCYAMLCYAMLCCCYAAAANANAAKMTIKINNVSADRVWKLQQQQLSFQVSAPVQVRRSMTPGVQP